VTEGVVLVDRLLELDRFGARLKPPSYGKLARDDILMGQPDTQSYRASLSFFIEQNPDLASCGLPSPFVALQDMYRIMASEWIIVNTYITRDLNAIGWALQGDQSRLSSAEQLDRTLHILFSIQWRLSRFPLYVQKPLQSCREHGHSGWDSILPADDTNASNEDAISADLAGDFEQVLSLLSQSVTRVEQSINHVVALSSLIHSKLGVQETERAVTQNNMLMVLSFVAIFFLPINSVSAIFSMQGDWAPGQPRFGLFWAIVVPLSTVLLVILMVLRFWTLFVSSVDWFRVSQDWRKEVQGTTPSVSV
jgi:hypothetical protein